MHGMDQHHTNSEKRITEPVSMSLEDVSGSIQLAELEKDLNTIIEEAREEHAERFLEK